jgi:tetratricopeptide (TPR) repeat protein
MQMTKVPISIIFHVEAFAMANSEKNKIVSELNNRAASLIDAGRYQEAIDLLTKALSLDPSRTGILFNRAEAHRLSGNIEAARKDLLSELQMTPDSPEVLHGLGLLAYEQDDFPLATEFYRKALDRDPAFAPAWNDLGVVEFRSQHYDSARTFFEKAAALDADFSEAWFNLADTYEELGMAEARSHALAQLRRARLRSGEKFDGEEDE